MSKLTYDITFNADASGANKIIASTKRMSAGVEAFSKSTRNLREELAAGKRELQNMFLTLDQAKATGATNEQLEEMNGVIRDQVEAVGKLHKYWQRAREAVRNAGDETRTIDAFKEGFKDISYLGLSAIGTIGAITGSTKTLTRAVTAWIAVTKGLVAWERIQEIARKKTAITLRLEAVATKANTLAGQLNEKVIKGQTKATILYTGAIKALNVVAKASPLQMFGVIIAGLAATMLALGGVFKSTTKGLEELNEESKEVALEGVKNAQAEITELNVLMARIKDTTLSMRDRIAAAQEMIDKYPGYFRNMSAEEALVKDLSKAYNQLKNDIIAVAKAKAYAGKIEELAKEEVEYEDKNKDRIDAQRKWRKDNQNKVEQEKKDAVKTGRGANYNLLSKDRLYENSIDAYDKKMSEFNKQQEYYINKIKDTSEAQKRLSDSQKTYYQTLKDNEESAKKVLENIDTSVKGADKKIKAAQQKLAAATNKREKFELETGLKESKTPKGGGGGTDTQKYKTVMEKLQDEVTKWEKQLQDVDIINDENAKEKINNIKNELNKAKKNLKDYKIAVGIEIEPEKQSINYYKEKIDELSKKQVNLKIGSKEWKILEDEIRKFEAEKHEIELSIITKGSEAYFDKKINELEKKKVDLQIGSTEWWKIQDEIEALKKEKIEIDATINYDKFKEELDKEISNILSDVDIKEYDFSFLKESDQSKANELIDKTKDIENEMQKLKDKMKDAPTTYLQDLIDAYEKLGKQLDENNEKLNEYNDKNKKNKDTQEVWGGVSDMIASSSIALDAFHNKEKAAQAQFILDSISKIAAWYAQTLAAGAASSFSAPWPASIAAWAQTAALIASIFSSLPKFEEGGIVKGSSWSGDNILGRLNSGERILTKDQNDMFTKLMNKSNLNIQQQQVEFVIKGKVLRGVLQNDSKVTNKII